MAVSKFQPSVDCKAEGYDMGRANLVLIGKEYIAKGDNESHDCQNENTISIYHSMPHGDTREGEN